MKYDVVVIGAGTAGCAAAYTTAKQGLKTLLIEKNSYSGGSITGALVTPAMKSSENQINTEFFDKFCKNLKSMGGQVSYIDNNNGWINPELAKIVFEDLLQEAGVEIYYNTCVTKIEVKNKHIESIEISSSDITNIDILSEPIETAQCRNTNGNDISVHIEPIYVIDTTGNQSICKALNCQQIDDSNKTQPVSLRFITAGVDLETFAKFMLELDNDREATTAAIIESQWHMSTACTWDKEWALSPIFRDALENNDLKSSDCAYFQVFTIPGMPTSLAFNCPRYDQNISIQDIQARSKALISLRKSILRILNFCKKYLPGFKNVYISSIAPELGVRVSSRALGEYLYTIEDLKTGKTFNNPVLVSNYPIDVHSDKKEGAILEKLYQEYQLPVEALHSIDYDNLYFAGRSISADFYAQAALRIIPSCFSMGEGLGKYLANLEH